MLAILEFRLWYSGSLFHFVIWLSESEDDNGDAANLLI
ncbi:hypothetical protein AD00_3623 [Escherichia coli 2-316-03_S4_C2]|nr:hypothetical protein AD00_3623 [Escherichia coli 2-316-03_S4_C2]